MDVSLLQSMTERVSGLATPSVLPSDAWPLGERVTTWARANGLVLGDPDSSPLGRARCDRLAARLFPAADLDRLELLGRWLTWAFALDDMLDCEPLAASATGVHGLYEALLAAVRRGHATPGARPLESTLVELWDATAAGMTRDWRRRFLQHMEEHRAGCAQEAVNRRIGEAPGVDDYPSVRRRACAPFLFDLVEPMLDVELPTGLLVTPWWKNLSEATADIVAWSNDVASHAREAERGDAHNHVTVLSAAYDFPPERTVEWVVERIEHRAGDLAAAGRTMDEALNWLQLTPERRSDVERVVGVFLALPRAHIDWLCESGRYRPRAEDRRQGDDGPRRAKGLWDVLASM
ncbi:hypothetical protein GCM10009678_81880 [Actinomadura kijaniata]